ncbi:MAG: M48 family metallopeptidase [Nanoarchaeota archaeon]|nr:M48 family metallopeptidase [Nanoarchaeota archaeon]MBU1445116.1 M48 family metallopeptidase [Nanoarchaeota archaeon]MBU2420098.1 M48 family metallopeptidase [Nanoarchaeota archaeon]MBU2475543.1 M48 family metallopeptidase [Nanoarchaeota archaeon]
MFDQIASNKRMTFFLFFIFSLLILILGFVIGLIWGSWIVGIVFAVVFSVIYGFISYYSGDKAILSLSKAKEVSKKDDPFLVNTVEGLAIAAGLPQPKVYVIKEDSINAFATGRDPQHATITVTSGAREKLNRQELEGVIAHEMSHIKNRDILVMMLSVMLFGLIVLFSQVMIRSFIFGGGRNRKSSGGGGIIILIAIAAAIIAAILAPLLAQIVKFAISRKREYLADANGALLTRYPLGLASALKKIRDDKDKVVDTASRATASLYIENPLRHKKEINFLDRLYMTHPDINERIKKLEAM